MFKRLISSLICICFIFSTLQVVHAQDFNINQLPVPGTMVGTSAPFAPLALKGLVVNPQKPLEFQFIVDTGKGPQDTASIKDQVTQLVKYFLTGLTIPEGDLWVNLSPYEKDRIIPGALGQTELGRDLLAQDYILKQLTASLIYPEKDLGREFWSRVYNLAQKQFGTTNVPVNTFNKVWILPNQVQVFENGNAAYVTKATLKVMLDEDYLALNRHTEGAHGMNGKAHSIASQIVRAIVLPEIEKEVNTGKNFAPLRQIYQALILAKWYKQTIQNGLLDAVYTNKSKIAGINLKNPAVKEQIYQRYIQAYKKGAFNYIRESTNPDGRVLPRKYFSGGVLIHLGTIPTNGDFSMIHADGAMMSISILVDFLYTYRTGAAAGGTALVAAVFALRKGWRVVKDIDRIQTSLLLKSDLVTDRIRGMFKEYKKSELSVRRNIQRIKETHLERWIDLLYALQDLDPLLKMNGGIPNEYLRFFISMSQDNSPDISALARQALAAIIQSGQQAKLQNMVPSSVRTNIDVLAGQKGVNLQKSLSQFAEEKLISYIYWIFGKEIRYISPDDPNIFGWILNQIKANHQDFPKLEYLLDLAGDSKLEEGYDNFVAGVRELLPSLGEDQEQLRGAVARALSNKKKSTEAVTILMQMLEDTLSGLQVNDQSGKIETIREISSALDTNGHPAFKGAWSSVFPSQEAVVPTPEKVERLKRSLGRLISDRVGVSANRDLIPAGNQAMLTNPGGIDLNQININPTDKKINVQFDPAQLNELKELGFKGFTPVIINMRFISSPLPSLGVRVSKQEILAKV